jgi:DNA-binding transcriptional regulator YdaS (Cro superfamily)
MAVHRNGKKVKAAEFRAALDHAIELAGGQSKLAEACEVTQAYISKVRRTRQISALVAKRIEMATAGKVPAKTFRPDLWG